MHKNPRSRITCMLLVVLAVLIATPLSAVEKAKIKLPDGVYMYNSSIERQDDGHDRVGFGKFFVMHNKNIYSSKDAFKKFGISKLNELFGGNKKYKILLNGEVIGEKYNLRFEKDEAIDREDAIVFPGNESYTAKNFKEGPMYGGGRGSILGSAARAIAVPEIYQAARTISFNAISKDEVERISKLVKAKLLPLVIKRKELKQYKIKEMELYNEKLERLDKISHRRDELYIGIYWYVFKNGEGSFGLDIAFSIKKDHVSVITTDRDDVIPYGSMMMLCGMLDVDGCGKEELIIEKEFPGEDEAITSMEIYKQQADGNWTQIKKIKTRRAL